MAFVGFACTVAFAQTTKTGSLAGQVVNSLTGETIANAVVFASPLVQRKTAAFPTAQSQFDGSFHFDRLPVGKYLVFARKTGFAQDFPDSDSSAVVSVTIEADNGQSDVLVPLVPLGVISGKVFDQNGLPSAETNIYALLVDPLWSPARLNEKAHAKTDSTGSYSLSKLEGGSYYILAIPKTGSKRKDQDGYGEVPTFFAEGSSPADGVSIFLQPGEAATADVRIHLAQMHRIDGNVEDLPKGLPDSQLRLEISPKGQGYISALRRILTIRPDHSFSATDIPAGDYEIRLSSENGGRRVRVGSQEIIVGSTDVTGVVLTPTQPASLTFYVKRDKEDSETVGAVGVTLQPIPGGEVTYGQMIGSSGKVTLSEIEPGSYLLDLSPAATGLCVQTVMFDGQNVANQYIDLPANANGLAIVVLGVASAIIGGKATAPASMVVLVPQLAAPDGSNIRRGSVKSDGTFEFRDLASGTYNLFAVEQTNGWGVWRQLSFVKSIEDLGTRVEIERNDNKQITLPVVDSKVLQNRALLAGFYLR